MRLLCFLLSAAASFAQINVAQPPYNADPTGVIDATTAINAALLVGGTVYMPKGVYLVSSTLQMTQPTRLVGDGPCSQLKLAPTFPATSDVVNVAPVGPGFGWGLQNFQITAPTVLGRNGIALTLATGASLNLLQLHGIVVGQTHGSGVFLTNNNVDGFFCSTIEQCCIFGGINLTNCGDSIRIRDNTITGVTPNGGFAGIFASQVAGAAQLLIENNNITASGGAIWLYNCFEPKVIRNQIEQSVPYTNGSSGVNACVYLLSCQDADIEGNNINAYSYVNCVRLYQTSACLLARNSMFADTLHGKWHGQVLTTGEIPAFLADNRCYSLAGRVPSGTVHQP